MVSNFSALKLAGLGWKMVVQRSSLFMRVM